MKKFLSIVLALAMSFSVMTFFTACGNDTTDDNANDNITNDGATDKDNTTNNDTKDDGLIDDAEDTIENAKDRMEESGNAQNGTTGKGTNGSVNGKNANDTK